MTKVIRRRIKTISRSVEYFGLTRLRDYETVLCPLEEWHKYKDDVWVNSPTRGPVRLHEHEYIVLAEWTENMSGLPLDDPIFKPKLSKNAIQAKKSKRIRTGRKGTSGSEDYF